MAGKAEDYEAPFDDYKEIFTDLLDLADLNHKIYVTILVNDKLKNIGGVKKVTGEYKHMTGQDVIITFNQKVFGMLDAEQRVLVADELVSQISFDSEKEVVTITKPKMSVNPLIVNKYSWPKVERLYECVKAVFEQKGEGGLPADEAKKIIEAEAETEA